MGRKACKSLPGVRMRFFDVKFESDACRNVMPRHAETQTDELKEIY